MIVFDNGVKQLENWIQTELNCSLEKALLVLDILDKCSYIKIKSNGSCVLQSIDKSELEFISEEFEDM